MEIVFNEVEHRYMEGTPFEKVALQDCTIRIPSGSFTAVIGHTGSGKSTLIQHINGLLRPTKGTVQIGPYELKTEKKKVDIRALRQQVGLVFQYPEHQLFEETVAKDICFGPMNFGVPFERALKRAKELLPQVGLPEEILTASPFELSGGQMRRVAIAGVLASQPKVLVLDEPAASLDPEGHEQIMRLFVDYHHQQQTTTVLVTHHMEDAARYADQIIVLHEGKVEMAGGREIIFEQAERLREIGLDLPAPVRFLEQIKQRFALADIPKYYELERAADYVARLVEGD
ncbi:energy-coupling factor transporter ATPase [Halalkalibacter oceani]|uniref:energy-coupling factor transporter ATPase n=1 Tax=Halalkalibacter oceani TaxID=1653776 RepID=UPI00339AE6A4